MRSAVEKLVASEGIIEWIDPDDQRLVIATGESMPNSGGATRTEWGCRMQRRGTGCVGSEAPPCAE